MVVDGRRAELADQRRVLTARGAPQFQAGHPAEHEQRLTDGTGGSMHEHTLSLLHMARTVKKLVCGRPAQDHRGRLRRVDTRRYADQIVRPERTIGGVRS